MTAGSLTPASRMDGSVNSEQWKALPERSLKTSLCSMFREIWNMFAVQNNVKPDKENIRGLNLAVVKLTTVEMTKLSL
jgi:hypothetical protein